MNADGTRQDWIYGFRTGYDAVDPVNKGRAAAMASASLIDDLPQSEDEVLIAVWPWNTTGTTEPFTTVERLDVNSKHRITVARAPVRRAGFVTDSAGEVRFAVGASSNNMAQTWYRAGKGAKWELLNDEAVSNTVLIPIGFSAGDKLAYMQVRETQGPDSVYAWDPATKLRRLLVRDDDTDPSEVIWSTSPREPVGVMYMDGKPRAEFFDESHPMAKLHRSLQNSFNGDFAWLTSSTADGKLALVRVASDRSPGDYYLFDLQTKQAAHLLSRRDVIDPERMGERRPITLKARDGQALHGYLTLPAGSSGRHLPMVVHPHGGPFGPYEDWFFDRDPQLLASRGYAVLQLDFRGSGNHGRAFERLGYKQWGGSMQDDLTDATRWAIQQGIADPKRICLYGASYGGYASLMGVAKEPDLYRCAVGYVGVYDMNMMYHRGDIHRRSSGKNYLLEALGTENLDQVSPNRLAARIKAPVFLAAGGEDERAPQAHSEAMEKALKAAGVPVETLYYPTEAHGFYTVEHNREFYTRLLAFLDRHSGAGAATTTTSATAK
jgi:dipeptidyl aminopeptidase/acylaminoacyl peptidase